MIRVVVAEDAYLVREGIQRLLETEQDIDLVAACEDLPSLLEAIEAERPDRHRRRHGDVRRCDRDARRHSQAGGQ